MSLPQVLDEQARFDAVDSARERLLAGIPVVERTLQLAGVSTALLEGGNGPPVILLHEQGEFAARWLRVIPELVKTRRVIAPDLPGHGSSRITAGRLNADLVLAWLGELIERTCPSPPVLVGHMLGGAIAARFAVAHSDRLSQLVLVDSFGIGPFRPKITFVLALIRYIVRPTERSFRGLLRHCTVDPDGLRARMGERWEHYQAYVLDRARTPSVQAAIRGLMGTVGVPAIPPADLERIAVPTTLIWGRHDPVMRRRTAERASTQHGWPLHVIDNAADDAPMEQPEVFLGVLRNVLGRAATR
jgi:pimeloyl-ACP methyl ester carboxylesterase